MDERVLLVEDDPAIGDITARGLGEAGFSVIKELDGRQSLVRFRQEPFDLVILDVMLPSLSGLEVCRQIRTHSPVPILMLTARTETADVVLGLDAGADDYVTKPFEMPELVARARALLRRVGGGPEPERITVDDVEIDVAGHRASRAGAALALTATEFKLLVALARHAGQVMTREMLLEIVWDYDYLGDSRVVDMAVKRLREKVDEGRGESLVETVRGVGYRIDRDE